jgi:hypothetical protein
MKAFRVLGAALLVSALAVGAVVVRAANVPTLNAQNCQTANGCADINTAVNNVNANVPGYAVLPPGNRNFLENGGFFVNQFGTAAAVGGVATGCTLTVLGTTSTYFIDDWCVDTNVTSGVGKAQVITSSPAPPPGFQNAAKIWRNSAALLQPVVAHQEIETSRFTQLQGKTVIASCYVNPLAGLTSTNGAVAMNLAWGTGTDEGLGTMSTSPLITPAFTGVTNIPLTAGVGSPSFNLGTTAGWTRIYSTPVAIPLTATEGDFMIGFTPVGSASGATDGFAFVGCQLEIADNNQTVPTAFEFLPYQYEFARAQRRTYVLNELAAGVVQVSGGTAQGTTTTCTVLIPFPVTMRAAPVYTNALSATTFKIVSASQSATILATPFSATLGANGVNAGSINLTTTGMTAKDGCLMVGAAGSGQMMFTANF